MQDIYMDKVRNFGGGKALIMTFGCQQNEADSDKIRGMLCKMGYTSTEDKNEADVIIINTCAVREHAELRVFGVIGSLKVLKEKKPGLIIGVCGCMVQQAQIVSDIEKKYSQVDILFGTHSHDQLPRLMYEVLSGNESQPAIEMEDTNLGEELPVQRQSKHSAAITVMYGCNNFCTYCIVPYVRGRERSRSSDNIVSEIAALVKEGYKEFMLLGQNVNSYGKGIEGECGFAGLLRKINAIEGDFLIRFMSSHPKDVSLDLIDAMAECEKVERHLHLPIQSGSDRLLKIMNRHYTCESYKKIVDYARVKIPDIALTSDIIVGFPGETDEDFEDTIKLIKDIRYDLLFTFIYSKRKGTPAYNMDNQVSKAVKDSRMARLMETQNIISKEINDQYVGTTQRVLVAGESKNNPEYLTAHTSSGKIVNFKCDKSFVGKFINVKVTEAKTWSLLGEKE